MTSDGRIFLQVASYCDEECAATLRDAFARAAEPALLSAGVCWQFDPAAGPACCPAPPGRGGAVRQVCVPRDRVAGGVWARAAAQGLWRGEAYTLQVDAHMRFAPGWDAALRRWHARCGPAAILTGRLPEYVPPDRRERLDGRVYGIAAAAWADADDPQMVHLGHIPIPRARLRGEPFLSAVVVYNFIFAPSEAFARVPHDPQIDFKGAELSHSARWWTHGYDFYQVPEVVAYHYWRRPVDPETHAYKYRARRPAANARALERVRHLYGLAPGGAAATVGLEAVGLGRARGLAAYWEFADLDLAARRLGRRAWLGAWDRRLWPRPP